MCDTEIIKSKWKLSLAGLPVWKCVPRCLLVFKIDIDGLGNTLICGEDSECTIWAVRSLKFPQPGG